MVAAGAGPGRVGTQVVWFPPGGEWCDWDKLELLDQNQTSDGGGPDDLYYLIKLAFPGFMEFGLKKIIRNFPELKTMYDAVSAKEEVKRFKLGVGLPQSAYLYGALDVLALYRLWEMPKVVRARNTLVYKVDMLSQHYALIYQRNGLKVDISLRDRELTEVESRVEKYRRLLPSDLNPNSYRQVRKLLGSTESDHAALIRLAGTDPRASYIIELKKALKQKSYLESLYPVMRTFYNVYGAVSGRFSSTGGDLPNGMNAQQIPRPFQYMFNQPDSETSIVYADYSTLELRLACALFNEPAMYKQLKEGRDLHTEMARQITGKPEITKEDRQAAKAVNFGYVFGMSANTYAEYAFTAYGVNVSQEEALKIRNRYFSLYRGFHRHHQSIWKRFDRGNLVVHTALGRPVCPKRGTDGINIPVQGSGAETTKLAVHYLVKDYGKEVLGYIYNVVHDAIYLRVPRDGEEYWKEALVSSMLKGWTELSKTKAFHFKDIPMVVEPEVYIKE